MTERIFYTIEPGAKLSEPKPTHDENKDVRPAYRPGWATFGPDQKKTD